MPKISIVIPVYNAEKYLAGCLDSLLGQTFQDFEVICVDDGSGDKSQAILQQYRLKDNRFKVFAQENKGQADARNAGLDHVTGEYVLFLDSDDTLPDYALALLLEVAEKTSAPIVASRKWLKFPKNKHHFIRPIIHRNTFEDFVKDVRVFSAAWNKLYRADILKTHRFVRGICFEDWPFLTTLFSQVDFYVAINTPCYIYNKMDYSTIRSPFSQKKVDGYVTGIWYVYNFFKDRPTLPLAQKRLAVAAKMLINKVYKSKDKALIQNLFVELDKIFKEGVIRKNQLPVKTRFRLWRMRHM
ncbi:MAG: glycosyltransferase family 2 protein [Alphaproteobacteria bacterium]|nr:glycosyltransferase family 2 protein [Alphaproteobacteria bacterium]